MDPLLDIYHNNPDLWNMIMALLIFGGMGRIAFWSTEHGMDIGGMLATGLALMLTIALLTWVRETGRCIQSLGPWAAFVLIQAILILAFNARRKSREM